MLEINRTKTILILCIILSIAVLIRIEKMDQPFGGYHAMNEAWYSATAKNYSKSSFMNPTVSEYLVDYKVRPVYTYISYLSMRLFGFSEFSPRLVTVMFSVISIIFVFLTGRLIRDSFTGIAAAAILAVCPAYVVCGRQAQPDAAYVSIMLISIYLFLLSKNSKHEILLKICAGIIWGISIFTKNFAVMLLPGLIVAEIFYYRSFGKVFRKLLLFLFIAILIPMPFIIYHSITHPGELKEIYSNIAFRIPGPSVLLYMSKEIIWGLSPLVFIAAVTGIITGLIKRDKYILYIILLGVPFLALYFVLHVHSYYILGIIPFAALTAAVQFRFIKSTRIRISLLTIVLMLAAFNSVMVLASQKWDQDRFKLLSDDLNEIRKPIVLVIQDELYRNYRSLFFYYVPDAKIYYCLRGVKLEENDPLAGYYGGFFLTNDKDGYASISPESKVVMVDFANIGSKVSTPFQKIYGNPVNGLCFGRKALIWKPFNRHSFIPEMPDVLEIKGNSLWGINRVAFSPGIIATEMPEGYRLYHNGENWEFRRINN